MLCKNIWPLNILQVDIKDVLNMKCCSCCGPKTKYFILLLCGLVLIALPLGFHDFIDKEIKKEIANNVKIAPGSQVYDQWKKPTIPIYFEIYAFNIVNPLEVMEGKPPFVQEKGPYSYREIREKVNITWEGDNVNYNQVTHYVFDPETSCDGCDDTKDYVTSVNIPYVTVLHILKSLVNSKFVDEVVSAVMEYLKEDLFETKSVNETIWGYKETMFEVYDKFREELGPDIGKLLPFVPPVFALQPNPNFDGNTTINTGKSHIDLVGCYQRWKDNFKFLHIWHSTYANMLNGTDGSIYKPDISKDDTLYIFINQICRSLNIDYIGEVSIRGIRGYQFHPPTYLFESGSINPDNKAFCNPNCLPTGLLSVNACVPFNAPIVVSSPHFLNGNKSLQKMILGLKPDEEKHDTFVSIEPKTGVLLQASKRLQFNIDVEPMDGIKDLQNVKAAYIPIMWINEHVSIDEDNANKLKKNVLNKLEIIKWVEIGLLVLGGLMVVIAVILFIRLCCLKKKGTDLKLMSESTPNYGSSGHTGQSNPSLINASD